MTSEGDNVAIARAITEILQRRKLFEKGADDWRTRPLPHTPFAVADPEAARDREFSLWLLDFISTKGLSIRFGKSEDDSGAAHPHAVLSDAHNAVLHEVVHHAKQAGSDILGDASQLPIYPTYKAPNEAMDTTVTTGLECSSGARLWDAIASNDSHISSMLLDSSVIHEAPSEAADPELPSEELLSPSAFIPCLRSKSGSATAPIDLTAFSSPSNRYS